LLVELADPAQLGVELLDVLGLDLIGGPGGPGG